MWVWPVDQDFRLLAIHSRLSSLKLAIPVVSPKGGVGKSTISAMLSLVLAMRGVDTGLLDLDVTNPTLHTILGIDVYSIKLEEVKGVKPLQPFKGLEFMSVGFFTRGAALPIRGTSIVNLIRDLLSITNWNSRVLVVDTPPGFSDEILELLLLLYKTNPQIARPLVVTTQSSLSLISAKRLLDLIGREGFEVLGIVCNMCSSIASVQEIAEAYGIEILGCVPFIQDFDNVIGDARAMLKFAQSHLSRAVDKILGIVGL